MFKLLCEFIPIFIWPLDTGVSTGAIERQHRRRTLLHMQGRSKNIAKLALQLLHLSPKNYMEYAQPPCSDAPSPSFICWGERVLTCIILKACTTMQTLAFFTCPHCCVYVWETEDEQDCGTGCFLVVCVGVCVWECAQNPTQAHVHFFTRNCRLGVEIWEKCICFP